MHRLHIFDSPNSHHTRRASCFSGGAAKIGSTGKRRLPAAERSPVAVEGTLLCVTPASAPAPRAPAPASRGSAGLWPLVLPACRSSATSSQSIWLSRTPRTRQGEQSFPSRWMMSSTMQPVVVSVAACSSYGNAFFGVLLKNTSYLHFV